MTRWLNRTANMATTAMGHWSALVLATMIVVAWVITDRPFDFLDAISAATFWAVFAIQNSQNRDTAALHKKMDELLVTLEGPDSNLAGIEKED